MEKSDSHGRNLEIVRKIRSIFGTEQPVPLHAPVFFGNEKQYLSECIDTTYVSYVGPFVSRFDSLVSEFTGAKHAVAMCSGTMALHMALLVAGVDAGDEVITQALTFVGTINPIRYLNAWPVFLDSSRETLGLSAEALRIFLESCCEVRNDGRCYNRGTGRRVAACIPVHVFGHSCEIDAIKALCDAKNIVLIEDAAESLGSFYKGKHTGTFGQIGVLSFNGNKTITTGGGGMLLTNDDHLAARARHLSTTAKLPHKWDFFHDDVGYNYRLPNTSAAIGCAQMENLPIILQNKRELSDEYRRFFGKIDVSFVDEPQNSRSNFWLNAILLSNREERDAFLTDSNSSGVMTRPIWTLMSKLPMYEGCQRDSLEVAEWLADRVVNIPSSVRL